MHDYRLNSDLNYKIKIPIYENMDKNINLDDHLSQALKKNKKGIITNEKNLPLEGNSTTERKTIDILKDCPDSQEVDDTSVDMKTNIGEENITIKTTHNFNTHVSNLKFILNNSKYEIDILNSHNKIMDDTKRDFSQIEEKKSEKNSKIKSDKDKDMNMDKEINDKDKEESENKKINEISDKKNDETIKEEANKINDYNDNYLPDTFNYEDDFNEFDYAAFREMYFKEVVQYKKRKYRSDYETYIKNIVFHTKVIYEEKECILLLNKEFFYILKNEKGNDEKDEDQNKPKSNNNPEQSLLHRIQEDETNNIDKNTLKIDYELSHPLLCLNFNLLSCKLLLNKNNINNNKKNTNFEIKILILGSSKVISFIFKNYEIYQKFAYKIGSMIHNSDGYKRNKLGLSLRNEDFYKDTYINLKYFESTVKTGDLLLFRSYECLPNCQRFFTRDQYDHVCLIIKNGQEIQLFESNSGDNCNILKWDKFKRNLYNLAFKKVVLRRLNIEEEDPIKLKENQDLFQQSSLKFVEKINKKKYSMSIFKMVFDTKPQEYEIKGEWDKSKGFCCSALVAAFYLNNGIMRLKKSVHCVKPGDFDQDKNKLIFEPGYSFGPEKILEFST
jgi:hypothetical protein